MLGSLGYSVLAVPAGVALPVGTVAVPPPPNTTSTGPSPALAADKSFFVSPAYQFDAQAGVLVLQLRNSATGAVVEQIPSQAQLEQYRYSGAPNVGALISDTTV